MRALLPALLLVAVLGPAATAADPSPGLPAGEDFGAEITLTHPTSLAEVVGDPERFEGRPILLRGRVSDVCQRKGCWTILRDGSARIRVRFLDYGFFLPTDATGAEAFAEGVVKLEVLSEGVARHYEEESRDGDPDSVRGPRREVGFTASGVRLVRRD